MNGFHSSPETLKPISWAISEISLAVGAVAIELSNYLIGEALEEKLFDDH